MGVKNLWSLLEPTGRRVNIETLGGKRVAVDASIWLVQFIKAMRDERGDMLPNAHLMGFFRRICRLLYHRISPIFVFDGATPALKRRTTAARRRVRENKQGQVRRTAEKLLLNAMKQSALNEALRSSNWAGASSGPTSTPNTGGPATNGTRNEVDLTNDETNANAIVLLDDDPEWDEAEASESSELESEEEDIFIPDADDIDPAVLASLPPSVQMEVMLKMRERRVAENREHFQQLAGNMRDFSEMQMSTYLKSTKLKRTMEKVIKDGGGGLVNSAEGTGGDGGNGGLALADSDGAGPSRPNDTSTLAGKRIASNNDREFVFSKPVLDRGGAFASTSGQGLGDTKAGNDDFAKSLFGPPRENKFGGSLGRGRGRGRGGFSSGPLRAPQERFLISSVNPALPTPTVSRTIAEMPVLPEDQRAGNEGKDTLDLQITFDAQDVKGVDPLFADGDDGAAANANTAEPTVKPEVPAKALVLDEISDEDEWEDVQDEKETEPSTIDLVRKEKPETSPKTEWDAPVGTQAVAPPKRAAFWSLNHGFLKGRSLGQWDAEEEEQAVGGDKAADDDGLEAAVNAVQTTTQADRKRKAQMEPEPKVNPIDVDEECAAAARDDQENNNEVRDVEDGDLQAAIAASLAPVADPEPSRASDDGGNEKNEILDAGAGAGLSNTVKNDEEEEEEEDEEEEEEEDDDDDDDDEEVDEPPSPGSKRAEARRAAATPVAAPRPSHPSPFDDDTLLAAVTAAETAAAEAAERARLEQMLGETHAERGALRAEARAATAGADAPTEDMYRQIQDLLTLFGIPYVIAPQEAEAQCSWMNDVGLVDAVVTDDSDAFLFGAKHVYRNVFESKKYVEAYSAERIKVELGLDRVKMAHLALLLGSDYTEGVQGVGIVNALEIVTAFQGVEGLTEFKKWCDTSEFTGAVPKALRAKALPAPKGKKQGEKGKGKIDGVSDEDEDEVMVIDENPSSVMVIDDVPTSQDPNIDSSSNPLRDAFFAQHKSVKKGWDLPSGFPSAAVLEAYSNPSVDSSREKLTWGKPDLQMLRLFCEERFDWLVTRTDKLLVPVLTLWEKADHQSRIDRFFHHASAPHEFNERFAKYRSERIRTAVAGLTGHAIDPELALEAAPEELAGEAEKKKKKTPAKPKAKPKPKAKRSAGAVVDEADEAGDSEVPKTKPRAKKRAKKNAQRCI